MADDRSANSRPPRIVAIDDDPLVRRMLERLFRDERYEIATADCGRTGIELFTERRPDVLILDNVLPDLEGIEILRQVREHDPQIPVILITAQGTSLTAIEAMKWGAFDYLSKPLDLPRLAQQVERALEARRLMRVPVQRASEVEQSPSPLLLGQSSAMQEVYKLIGRVAQRDMPVLIEGETGTGKELVARTIHLNSPRAAQPFLAVKCTDFSAEWLESELFGHEAGALTGTAPTRVGKLQQADGGTLLIEEIGETSPATQSKLLRLLRDKQYERSGSVEAISSATGVIATTSEPLHRLVEQGQFRADLFYLLESFKIALPPLRARPEDIPLLVDHFVKRASRIGRTFGEQVTRVSPEALDLLAAYSWPGNVDELQAVVRRALIETGGAVVASDFLRTALQSPAASLAEATGPGTAQSSQADYTYWPQFVGERISTGSQSLFADAVAEMQRQVVTRVLAHTEGNQLQAARILGITRGSLRKKIRQLGIPLANLVGSAEADESLAAPS